MLTILVIYLRLNKLERDVDEKGGKRSFPNRQFPADPWLDYSRQGL
jgi:hypothetical protein